MFAKIRSDRFRLRVRLAVLAEIDERFPGDAEAYLSAGALVVEARAALPWVLRADIELTAIAKTALVQG